MKRRIFIVAAILSLAVSVNLADENEGVLNSGVNSAENSSENSSGGVNLGENSQSGVNLDDIATYELEATEITAVYEVDAQPNKTIVSAEEIERSGAASVEQALKRTPGIYFKEANGASASSSLSIRGFSGAQLGTYIDGIPMMSIYNGGADFAQFATSGLSGIEVSKSFADPALGVGTLGGAINMISGRPEKELDIKLKTTYIGSEDVGRESRYSVNLGTKQRNYYFMVDYSNTKRTNYGFSKSYKTGWDGLLGYTYNGHYELETLRLKLGWTHNENNEYSINYLISKGSRGGFQTTDNEDDVGSVSVIDNYPPDSYSEYPTIDTQTIYMLGTTYFLPNFFLDSRLFYQSYANELSSINAGAGRSGSINTIPYQWGARYGDSGSDRFNDLTYGMVLNFNYVLNQKSKFEFGINAKYSEHNQLYPVQTRYGDATSGFIGVSSGWQNTSEIGEMTSSIFAKYSQGLGKFRLMLALSYDRTDTTKMNVSYWAVRAADGSVGDYRRFKGPVSGKFAWQGILYYDFLEGHSVHINVGQKHRMPTLSERYSSGNKDMAPNPDLKPESAINYELGYNLNLPSTIVSFAVYYNDLRNMFDSTGRYITTDVLACPEFSTFNGQSACYMIGNIPKGYTYGGEIAVEQGFFKDNALVLGASYSYIMKHAKNEGINETYADYKNTKITGYANHIVQGKLSIKPVKDLEITGYLSYESAPYIARIGSWTRSSSSGDTDYVYWYDRFADNYYFNIDLMLKYLVGKGFSVNFGVYNLTDKDNYVTTGGSGQFRTKEVAGSGSLSGSTYPIYNERLIYKNHLAGRRYFAGFEWRY